MRHQLDWRQTMAVSKDRVRFHLAMRYFQLNKTSNGMCRNTCIDILVECFGFSGEYWEHTMHSWSEGFDIICRPSQFARFIVRRHEKGDCINGIRDLNPVLQQVQQEQDAIDMLCRRAGQPRYVVRSVLNAIGMTAQKLNAAMDLSTGNVTDVSGNFNN